jgi:hypothetical protein
MTEAISRVAIKLTADSSEVVAAVDKAKRSIKGLGDANKDANKGGKESIAKTIKAYQDQADAAGQSASDIKLAKLAQQGATQEQLHAAAAALLTKDATKQLAKEVRAATDAENAAAQAKEKFLQSLELEAATTGKSRAEMLEYRAAQLGLSKQAAAHIDTLKKSSNEMKGWGQSVKLSKNEAQQLGFQLNDLFVQVASGGAPLTALIQQGSQLNGTFGGMKGTLQAISSVFTPFRLGLGLGAAALGTLALAYADGYKQSTAFNRSLVLSGNYAGKTESEMGELAKTISKRTDTTVSAVREMETALADTGQVGASVFDAATEAAVRYAEITGKTKDEVAADFADMRKDPLKFLDTIDKSKNLFSASQRDAIKRLAETGQAEAAQMPIFEKIIARYTELENKLGGLERAYRKSKSAASNFWDAVVDQVTGRTLDVQTAPMRDLANSVPQVDFSSGAARPVAVPETIAQAANQSVKVEEDKEQQSRLAAKEKALTEARNKKEKEVNQELDDLNRSANPAMRQKEVLEKFDTQAGQATPGKFSKGEIARMRQRLVEDTTDPQILQNAGVSYESRVQKIKDALDREQAMIAFQNQSLQGQYQAGNISLKQFYDAKVDNIRNGTSAEVDALEKEQAAARKLLQSVVNPVERRQLQEKIAHYDVEKEKAQKEGSYQQALANQDLEASYRQLDDQVQNYQATLKQLAGDELGAATIRQQIAERQAKIFAKQSGGKISDEDVAKQTALQGVQNRFNDVSTRSGYVAQSTARAEEATILAADLAGKSLLETENDIYAVRSRAVEQLGKLKDEAAELARLSTDPKIKQFAADLALQYANAVAKMDPALQRLRDAQKELSAGIASTINSGIASLPQNYIDTRKASRDEVKSEKDKFDRKIDILEGYLATTRDKNDKARLREKIANLQAQKDDVKGDSKAKSFLKTIDKTILQPIGGQVMSTASKVLFTDPLQKSLEKSLRDMTEGEGSLAGFFKDTMGIKDPKAAGLDANAAAANASATALDTLATAANSAAGAIGGKGLPGVSGANPAVPSIGDAPVVDDPEAAQAQVDARQAVEGFSSSTLSAANDVAKMAAAAGKGGGALGLLPSIINTISSAMAMFTASTTAASAGNSGNALASIFGKIGTSASAGSAGSDAITSYYFHTGGVVGGSARTGSVSSSIFANAPRYHTGGLVGKKADALKSGEVPAILMRNEEVLREDDPRHRGNLGAELFKQIMAGAKPWNQTVADGAKEAKPEGESLSGLLRTIAGGKGDGENSAEVLGGLLSRLGVKEGGKALKVAGGRAIGGPVSAGGLYEVNEKGRPELLQVAGKEYLMMGSQGGKVNANPQMGGGGQTIHMPIYVTPPAGSNANTAAQWGTKAGREIQHHLRRNG